MIWASKPDSQRSMKALYLLLFVCVTSFAQLSAFSYEKPEDYPLMGDWTGQWVNATRGHEKLHPGVAAKLLPVQNGKYRVVILPELYNRTEPYLVTEVKAAHQRVEVRQTGWDVVFEGSEIRGRGKLHGAMTEFVLTKVPLAAPTYDLSPPASAIVLFDGTDFSAWEHREGGAVTWAQIEDTMQVVTKHSKANHEQGLGGDIQTKQEFGSLRFHMEFRYPVEANKSGQSRGNSGLFFYGVGEVQILNSYGTPNYWHECGSIYKRVPAKVDAAGPPLEWQTYDVELTLPEPGESKAYLTVLLNGKILHNKTELDTQSNKVRIGLQDHINLIQFRNIWLVED